MKLHILKNGKDRKWGFWHSLFDFFFPIQKRLRMECETQVEFAERKVKVVGRTFYTFRAFAIHYLLAIPFVIKVFLYEYKNALDQMFLADRFYYVRGAITYDTTSASTAFTNATSASFSHTNTGSNLVMTLGVAWFEFTTANNNCSPTYNSVALNSIINKNQGGTPTYRCQLWQLANPATGANTLALSFVGGAYGAAGVISFSGADTTNPVDASASETALSATSISKSITTNYANSIIVSCIKGNDTNTGLSATGTNQTLRWNVLGSNTNINAGSSQTTTSAGSYTHSYSYTTSQSTNIVLAAIRELVTTTVRNNPTLLTLGVG